MMLKLSKLLQLQDKYVEIGFVQLSYCGSTTGFPTACDGITTHAWLKPESKGNKVRSGKNF